jgi:hydrogenase maturation factor HypF (carbamoyltransferase family)
MPALVVHCRNCRHLLNDDLEEDTVVEPAFVPLKEIPANEIAVHEIAGKEIAAVVSVEPRGVYDECPACGRELRINRKYTGSVVRCKHCGAGFTLSRDLGPAPGRVAYYADCPHCDRELRIATKYLGQQVACKFCRGQLRFSEREPARG